MATTYTISDDRMPAIGTPVHVWRIVGHRNHYINHVPDGLDAATQRVTPYGIRGDGQGEDDRVHEYAGPATVIARDMERMTVTVEMDADA